MITVLVLIGLLQPVQKSIEPPVAIEVQFYSYNYKKKKKKT